MEADIDKALGVDKLLGWITDFLIDFVDKCVWWNGFIFGLALFALINTPAAKSRTQKFWLLLFGISALLGPVAYLFLPGAIWWLAHIKVYMTNRCWIIFMVEAFAGSGIYFWWIRCAHPWLNEISHKLTKRTSLERNRRTDVRDISRHLPDKGKQYDPIKYVEDDPKSGKGLFLGLDEKGSPIYVPYERWRKSHVQIIGTTGSGKGVASALMLSQALRAGESVFVLDPKDDEWAPHVLNAEAARAGVPFYLVDLRKDIQQLDLLAGVTAEQLEELFISGFSLAEKGEAADFYRISDRRAAHKAALLAREVADLQELFSDERTQELQKEAEGFFGKLEELSLLTAINAPIGLDLRDVVQNGGCVYIIGSMRHSRLIMAQRMLFIRLLQLAERRDRVTANPRPMCVFLDELKYHISRPALEGLGAARDKGMHLVLAHQSLADLYDCPADLKAEAVVGSVVENCSIRLAYQVQNPETAKWLAQMSGEILVDDEIRRVDRNPGGAELMHHERTVRQATRQFIDVNMLRNLPPRTAVLFGVGLPQFAQISPIETTKREIQVVKKSSAGGLKEGTEAVQRSAEGVGRIELEDASVDF